MVLSWLNRDKLAHWSESWIAVGLFYLVLIISIMWPTSFLIGERLIGDNQSDFWKHAWGHWWVIDSLLNGKIPLFCDLINSPSGGYLFVADPFNCLFDGILLHILPFSVAYNCWVIVNVWGGCMAAWALACYFVHDRKACLVAGAIYGISAYMLAYPVNSGVSETLNSAWIPLYMLFCHKVTDRGNFSDIMGAFIFFFLTAFSCWYYGEFMVVYSAVVLFYKWYQHLLEQKIWCWKSASWYQFSVKVRKLIDGMVKAFIAVIPQICKVASAIALAGILISPLALMFQMVVSDPANIVMPDKAPKRSMLRFKDFMGNNSAYSISERGIQGFHNYTNILGFFLPGKGNGTVTVTVDKLTRIHYLGWLAIILAWVGYSRRKELNLEERQYFKYWLGTGIFFLILSLGPKATLSDFSSDGFLNPVYIFMYVFFPMFHKIAVPFRYLALALLALGTMASFGLKQLYKDENDKLKSYISIAVTICIVGEIALISPLPWPLPSSPARIPTVYSFIAKEEGDFSIIDYPFERVKTQLIPGEYFYYQTLHHKRIPYRTSGVLSTEVARNSFMEELSNAQFGVSTSEAMRKRMVDGIKQLKSMGFKYLILHQNILGDLMMGYLQRALRPILPKPLVFADGTVVYLLEPIDKK